METSWSGSIAPDANDAARIATTGNRIQIIAYTLIVL